MKGFACVTWKLLEERKAVLVPCGISRATRGEDSFVPGSRKHRPLNSRLAVCVFSGVAPGRTGGRDPL